MGESIVESPTVEYKMGETVTSVPTFQQSVSFGRFELDSLCWEKWSTFPTNKYLDEVEKCSTPGSVAQKKAYFEAHYKGIAARRAELLLDQERERATELVNPDDSAAISSGCNASEEELDNVNSVNIIDQRQNDIDSFNGEVIVEHVPVNSDGGITDSEVSIEHVRVNRDTSGVSDQENEALNLPTDMSEHIDDSLAVNDTSEPGNLTREKCEDVHDVDNGDRIIHIHEVSEAERIEVTQDNDQVNNVILDEVVNKEVIEHLGEPTDGVGLVKGTAKSPEEEISGDDLCPALIIPELGHLLQPASVTEDVAPIGDELPQEKVKRTIAEEKPKNLKLATPKKMHKATLVKKTTTTTNVTTKPASPIPKRTTAPMPKSPMLSTSKSVKPELTKVSKSANRLLDKKEIGFTPLSSKNSIGLRSKRVVPTSLHMSLNLGPVKSDQESLTRKSLIMEKMGDKDIVKRAFRSFQNTPQTPPSSLTKSPAINQSVSWKAESKGSPANTLPKKIGGVGRAATRPTTASTRTDQQGTRKMLLSLGVKKDGGADQRSVNAISASSGARLKVEGNIQKEVSKKLEVKPRSNVCEATNLQSKLKVDKAAHVKNLSQSIDSKPKLPSSYNRRITGSVHKDKSTSKI